MNEHEERVATVAGTAGHAALAVVSSMVGAFLIKAAVEHDPKEAIGLDGALQELATRASARSSWASSRWGCWSTAATRLLRVAIPQGLGD